MARRRKTARTRKRARSGHGLCEWVGGRITAPFFVEDGPEPYRPEMVLWIEQPSDLIVGQYMAAPEEADGVLGRALLEAMEAPLSGPPRRPDAIRVANAELALESRAAVGNAIPVTVAPTPELDALLQEMLESMIDHDPAPTYLDDGRISPDVVAGLFSSAQALYESSPWKVASDDQVLCLDIPGLAVERACVSIMGNLGESLGLMIFPSDEGYDCFLQAAEDLEHEGGEGRLHFGTDWLSLSFDRGADLPESMRREVASHGWPVADARAYPVVTRHDPDGVICPPSERDFAIAAACATALRAFFAQHRGLFDLEEIEPVRESYRDAQGLEVSITLPYEAHPLFEVNDIPSSVPRPRPAPVPADRARPTPGRNDSCPCGSGRKYKKCCIAGDQQAGLERRNVQAKHDLDTRLTHELIEFAHERFGSLWRGFSHDFINTEAVLQLAIPWSIHHYRVEGQSVLDAYLEAAPRRLSQVERGWLEAQQAAWLSLWEVSEVDPGASITLRDLLTDETRCVDEVSGSQTLVARDVLLARIVDSDGVSLLCGSHPSPLPPVPAAEVVRRARGRLRRKRAVPVERLRDKAMGRYLIQRWEEVVDDFHSAYLDRQANPPELQNTDGDPVLITIDHFVIAPGKRGDVEAQITALPDVEAPEADEESPAFTFLRAGNAMHKHWETTVIGAGRLLDTTLELETNSLARADALREKVEAACGGSISHRAREHADPLSAAAVSGEPFSGAEPPPEAEQMIHEFKRRHYADWPDHPLPALEGRTPREAVTTAAGRSAVDVLLKDMENHEQRAGDDAAFDFAPLRDELGLD